MTSLPSTILAIISGLLLISAAWVTPHTFLDFDMGKFGDSSAYVMTPEKAKQGGDDGQAERDRIADAQTLHAIVRDYAAKNAVDKSIIDKANCEFRCYDRNYAAIRDLYNEHIPRHDGKISSIFSISATVAIAIISALWCWISFLREEKSATDKLREVIESYCAKLDDNLSRTMKQVSDHSDVVDEVAKTINDITQHKKRPR